MYVLCIRVLYGGVKMTKSCKSFQVWLINSKFFQDPQANGKSWLSARHWRTACWSQIQSGHKSTIWSHENDQIMLARHNSEAKLIWLGQLQVLNLGPERSFSCRNHFKIISFFLLTCALLSSELHSRELWEPLCNNTGRTTKKTTHLLA